MRRHRILGRQDVFHPYYKAILEEAVGLGYALPSLNQQFAQNILLTDLVNSGIWNGMDLIYIWQNDSGSIDFGRLNWKSPTQFKLDFPTVIQPMYHYNLGMSGRPDLTGDFMIDTGWIPATHGVNFTQNLAGIYLSNLSGYGGMGFIVFAESGTINTNRDILYMFDGPMIYGINQVQSLFTPTAAQYFGVFGIDRLASNSGRLVLNGSGLTTHSVVSASRPTVSLRLLSANVVTTIPLSHYSPSVPWQCAMIGNALAGATQVQLTSYLVNYRNSSINNIALTVSGNYTVPADVYEMTVECWGGGGAGRGYTNVAQVTTGGGGGGGAYAASVVNVTPGQVIPYIIGAGGIGTTGAGGLGGNTSWNGSQIVAGAGASAGTNPAIAPQGGQASAATGQIKYSGGRGGLGGATLSYGTGSGGSAAGSLGNGSDGIDAIAGAVTNTRGPLALLGVGAAGVAQAATYNGPGIQGTFGSGGSGARRTTVAPLGGNGGQGYIRLSWPA